MISAARGIMEMIANQPAFLVMFVLVIVAVRFVTKASVRAISFATIAVAAVMIWTTGFPFWEPGRTLSVMQLGIGSAIGWAAMSLLAVVFDRYMPSKSAR
ncbi:MAG: hypothetical protein AAGK01_01595 [Pseudomonadota bacterium]